MFKEKSRPLQEVTLPYLVPDRAAWTSRSRKAVGRPTGTDRLEVVIGTGAVGRSEAEGSHVPCYSCTQLSDEEMQALAEAEARTATLPQVAAAMAIVVRHGLRIGLAGKVFGISAAEATRLHQVDALADEVKLALAQQKRTLNHARWILGLSPVLALQGLEKHKSVSDLKDWRDSLPASRSGKGRKRKAAPAPDKTLMEALEREQRRLETRFNAPVKLEVGEEGQRRLSIEYASVETLLGLLQGLAGEHGSAPPYPKGSQMRTLTISGLTDDELAFLTGTADS